MVVLVARVLVLTGLVLSDFLAVGYALPTIYILQPTAPTTTIPTTGIRALL